MALENKVIFVLANTRFDGEIQATSLFIARNLAKKNKVFFIDHPFTIKDYLKYRGTAILGKRREKFSFFSDGVLDTELPNFSVVVTPPVLPINFLPNGFLYRSMLRVNEWLLSNRINKIIKREKIKEFIYFNSFNFHFPNLAKYIKPRLMIYHCVDPMIIPYDKKHGIQSERELVEKSDVVICTSEALYEEKMLQNKQTYFVPNAADARLSIANSVVSSFISKKIAPFHKPIVGYLGTVERRIDYHLLHELSSLHPEMNFILAGPISDEFVPNALKTEKNIHFLGAVPYTEVGALIASFDVAIIPFKKDEVSSTIFPIKLFEYLSAGKPVVSSNFNPDLKKITGELVEYADDVHSFSEALSKALANDTDDKIEQRKALAKENTWEKRTKQIEQIIEHHL
ncbi:glycosyltransferase [Pedobacter sp. MW01-1-1]|uniref:glycosyltransferase n=1 Tax=Pedobacter sp. MW01-1-1 TaxID=3383027 RepID=UPI003FF12CF2